MATKKEKLETFDGVKAQRDRYMLTINDLIKSKFSVPIAVDAAEVDNSYREGDTVMYVRVSERRDVSLYLVTYKDSPSWEVYTETMMIQNQASQSTFHRMLRHGLWKWKRR